MGKTAKKKVVKSLEELNEIVTDIVQEITKDDPEISNVEVDVFVGETLEESSNEEVDKDDEEARQEIIGQILEDYTEVDTPSEKIPEVVIGVTHELVYDHETDEQLLVKKNYVDPETEITTIQENVTEVEEKIKTDDEERGEVLDELSALFTMLKIPHVSQTWEKMSTVQLKDLLDIVRKDSGGSIEVATLIQQTKEDFEVALNSEMMRSRLKIVEQKGSDFAKVAQKLNSMLGSDVIISGARTKEYHEMMKEYVKYIVTFTQKINSLAQFFNITLPVEDEFLNGKQIPIMEDMPCSPQISMYVLNVVMANLDRTVISSKLANEALTKANQRIEYLENQIRVANASVESASKEVTKIREETKRLLGNSSYWIVKDAHGRILRKKDAEKPLETPADLDLNGTIDTALFLTTQRSAEIMVERLSHSRRFRKHTLNSFCISIVKQTFYDKETEVEEDGISEIDAG